MVILTKNVLVRAHKKFQREILTLKGQDKTKMELPLVMVRKHAFFVPVAAGLGVIYTGDFL